MQVTKVIYGSLFIALGVVLPIGFHLLQLGGVIFLPMHIPVLLAGFILGGKYGLLVGLLTPLLSHLFTGMPPLSPPMLPMMIVELACYGLAAGILYRNGRNIYVALIGAMITGRIGAGVVLYLGTLFLGFHLPVWAFIFGGIMKGIPGIIAQLFFIPILVKTWEKYKRAGAIRGS
ncbi:MAG TPA: ECF transporter S component [Negativicutes bacterium]|nr:ECF transporter S component [Negativicutes bacterium]